MDKMLLSPEQAAEVIGVYPSMVRQWVKTGKLPHIRIGRCIRIPAQAVEAFAHNLIQDAKKSQKPQPR